MRSAVGRGLEQNIDVRLIQGGRHYAVDIHAPRRRRPKNRANANKKIEKNNPLRQNIGWILQGVAYRQDVPPHVSTFITP